MMPTKEVPLCRECLLDFHEDHQPQKLPSADPFGEPGYCKCPKCTSVAASEEPKP